MEGTIGEIRMVAYNFAPVGWALCNGATLLIPDYQNLYDVIGTMYGGDGKTNFMLPHYISRIPMGHGAGEGLPTYSIGQQLGADKVTLAENNLAPHTHNISAQLITREINLQCNNDDENNVASPQGAYPAISNDNLYAAQNDGSTTADVPVTINGDMGVETACGNSTGGVDGHFNTMPLLAMNYVICTTAM